MRCLWRYELWERRRIGGYWGEGGVCRKYYIYIVFMNFRMICILLLWFGMSEIRCSELRCLFWDVIVVKWFCGVLIWLFFVL